ncbi:tRNA dihydrouridine synthase DusB [Tautonia sociabilis]|uniref:tRNA-dihydrouridine synthase n=1 Tax=Tautonia sociabilis TaxID=2080755 RepID=A0A432MPP2_9BACT|nr:tRNA dihydrouridine synthase DusB [Tautonia sociabilis]
MPPPPPRAKEPLRIGSVTVPTRFFLSPLAGYTALAYRLTVRELGGLGLATTDLVNARSLIERRPKSFELAATSPEDQPASIQIYGATAWEMIEATKIVADLGPSIIDINMGCPVRKVVKAGGGSALMCDGEGARRLVEAVVEHSPVPVTVKMRLGWDQQHPTAPELARLFESIGVAAVIVHGRTRAQGFSGAVDRSGIARVVAAVERMPVVGNGDIRTVADAEAMFRETGCAAISIGRGALSNPFLFRQLQHWAEHGTAGPEPSFEDRLGVMERHFHRLVETRGEHLACLQFRKVLKWYSYAIRPPKELYLRLVNLPSRSRFDEVVAQIRAAGPSAPLPSQFEPRVPTPKGPIDRW